MQILKILKILADTKDNQIAYLKDLGNLNFTDELALEFDYTYQVFKWKFEESYVAPLHKIKVLGNLDCINSIFEEMSNSSDNSIWNNSSLDNQEWNTIRKIALETLPLILNF